MKKTALALAVIAAAGFSGAQAQNYQVEAGVGYTNTDLNDDSIFDVGAVYHLAPVMTAGLPLAEAAYLRNSSNIGLSYANFDDADIDIIGVQGEFYFEQLYLRAGYASTKFFDIDVDAISARIGYMMMPGLRMAAGVNHVEIDLPGVEATDDVVIEGKYVIKLAGATAANVEATLTIFDEEDGELVEVSGDYFFNPMLSVGMNAEFADNDTSYGLFNFGSNYGVNARYFFTPVISGQLQYATINDGDDDSIRVSAALRF